MKKLFHLLVVLILSTSFASAAPDPDHPSMLDDVERQLSQPTNTWGGLSQPVYSYNEADSLKRANEAEMASNKNGLPTGILIIATVVLCGLLFSNFTGVSSGKKFVDETSSL